jgi:hypothetical protein
LPHSIIFGNSVSIKTGRVENLSRKVENVRWRRDKVLELASKGYTQTEISRKLQIGLGTVNRDLQFLKKQAFERRNEFGEKLFSEQQKALHGYNNLLRKLWEVVDDNKATTREKMQAISLIMHCYDKTLDTLASEPTIKHLTETLDKLEKFEQELTRREQEVERFKRQHNIPDPNAVF